MVEYADWLELVRRYMSELFNFSDDEITSLLSENEDVVFSDYERVMNNIKENPEWKDEKGWVSGICQTLNLLA